MSISQQLFFPFDGIYLLNHSIGRPPVKAQQLFEQKYLAPWIEQGADTWPHWLAAIEDFRAALASLLKGRAEQFCPQTNLSSALGKILFSLPERKRKLILLSEQDFPTIGFVADKARQAGFEVRYLPGDARAWDIDVWDNQLNGEVGIALVTHVQSNTGQQVPVKAITELCRERDIISVIDIAQSIGVVPIDLGAWSADFVIGSCVKWACGGPGAGYLWADADIIGQCEPLDVGWFSHANPMEFDIHNFRYADGVLRFWGGTPSVMPYVVATAGLQTLVNIGIETIRQHNLKLCRQLMDAVPRQVLVSPLKDDCRGGTVVLDFADQQAQKVEALGQIGVQFDSRPLGLRLSPHIYNTADEIEAVAACLHA